MFIINVHKSNISKGALYFYVWVRPRNDESPPKKNPNGWTSTPWPCLGACLCGSDTPVAPASVQHVSLHLLQAPAPAHVSCGAYHSNWCHAQIERLEVLETSWDLVAMLIIWFLLSRSLDMVAVWRKPVPLVHMPNINNMINPLLGVQTVHYPSLHDGSRSKVAATTFQDTWRPKIRELATIKKLITFS